ncbi:MAG: ABC transporter ATP-binding protein [Gemmatimonadetes bacterium]|jgi:ABC-type multidrug transport system ATPase subunit|nr:ABC transporter ATP-binding protein [Gemmatimonadota bacterium]MBT4611566.1 ABC transporter ATP-binding protein [Gemmatimonadota bacterium]MBT5060035.1 ABC transporter ATP-binding protein [Gemmatimonadota bacterium]MBT5142132.1 ABC transporter ATP-binding protein [Gemmatimonadota bacterium]MBT5589283.1 ABC transporter ATP-binding protein [Gemmatimonadota bacterium]
MQIDIQELSKRYPGGHYALRDVDLQIGSGMFGLLGPNGAGKTTLIRILVTLLEPSSGRVEIDGLDLKRDRSRLRRMIGYLPQEFSSFPKLATWEYLDYCAALGGLRRKAARHERVDQLLHDVGLFDARDRQASKLSGGMKRRLGIAQTLVNNPTIMVVDEPTVGLDPQERLRFRNLLADLARGEIIIILSTHIVGDISSTCTDVALLNQGSIQFHGAPDDLVATAVGKVWEVTASQSDLDDLRQRYPVVSSVPAADGYEVRLVADQRPSADGTAVEPNLEDAYIHFMQSVGQDMDLEQDLSQDLFGGAT